ncbi:MAG: ABC transporter permease [Vulcanimicrobiaceae bacterium]
MTAISIMIRTEVRTRSRRVWTAGAALGLAILSVAMTYASVGIAREAGFGPSAGGLINVDLLVVPLVALLMGALAIARDKERGTLAYVRAQPITIGEIFWSKWLSLMLQLTAVVAFAFAATFAELAVLGSAGNVSGLAQFGIVTWLLALVMGSCGLALSAAIDKTPSALALAVGAWLFFVVFADLGVMVTALATRMGTDILLWVTTVNPIEAYKIAAICAIAGSVDVLGPGGRLATDIFGPLVMPVMIGVMIAWGAAAMLVARYVMAWKCRA